MPCQTVFKVNEGRPNAVDLLKAGNLQLVIYLYDHGHALVLGRESDTASGDSIGLQAAASLRRDPIRVIRVWSLQESHPPKA